MKKFIIIPDVTCDLSGELRERFGLSDYIKGYVNIDGKELQTTLDWTNIECDSFYKQLGNKKITISSAAASPEEYYQKFSSYAKDGYDIISMSISSKISGTYNIAVSAAERVKADYPDCRIECVDTLRMSGSFGLLVVYALELQSKGASMEEVVALECMRQMDKSNNNHISLQSSDWQIRLKLWYRYVEMDEVK